MLAFTYSLVTGNNVQSERRKCYIFNGSIYDFKNSRQNYGIAVLFVCGNIPGI